MSLIFRLIFIVCLCCAVAPARIRAQALGIPARPAGAKSGSEVYQQVAAMSATDRETAVYLEITRGNIPDFLRTLKPISVTVSGHSITYYVTPDCMAVGSDADFFRIPMTPILAQWIADFSDCSLPTRKMVNDIWSAAATKLNPSPIEWAPENITAPVFYQHHQTIEQQRLAAGSVLGSLIGGIKKDVVITPQMATKPGKVAIYGWHYTNGTPIQPLYLGHGDFYVDYSHGTRLVSNTVVLDGATTTVQAVMGSATLCGLVIDEGVQTVLRYPVSAPPAAVADWQLY